MYSGYITYPEIRVIRYGKFYLDLIPKVEICRAKRDYENAMHIYLLDNGSTSGYVICLFIACRIDTMN